MKKFHEIKFHRLCFGLIEVAFRKYSGSIKSEVDFEKEGSGLLGIGVGSNLTIEKFITYKREEAE